MTYKETVSTYNDFVRNCPQIESFHYCKKSMLNREVVVLFKTHEQDFKHSMAELCINNHQSYLTCISFKADVEYDQRHVCNIFPVMIGSELDAMLCSGEYEPDPKIHGLYIIDGALTIIPYLMTNRKEMGHRTKDGSDSIFCLFVYDKANRGYKISMNGQYEVKFRNSSGQDVDTFEEDATFNIGMRHLNLPNMKYSFMRLFNFEMDIDSLENKLVLSPVNILNLLILMAIRHPKKACENISRGYIEKFVSSVLCYRESKKAKFIGDSSGSFNFRKLQPNQANRGGVLGTTIR